MAQGKDKREHFRVIYPLASRPIVKLVGSASLQTTVADLSEGGLRLATGEKKTDLKVGQNVQGSVQFPDGDSLPFSGTILRVTEYDIVIKTKQGIPLPKVMSEQRRLIQQFGGLKSEH